MSLAALAVMAGHAFPVFLKFQGGKAVASFIGAFLYLTPIPMLAALVVFVIVVAATRQISMGSIVAAGALPLATWLIEHPPWIVIAATLVAGVFLIYRHRANIARIRAGTENVFSVRESAVNGGARIAIIGAGSWGTALAIVLAPRFESIRLWAHEADLVERMFSTRENDVFLPGFSLPINVEPTADLGYALADAGIVVGVMPSRFARPLYREMLPHLEPQMQFVSATKGLEQGTLLRMSEVARESIGEKFEPRVAVLSGPTFAREVARGDPTAVVIAAQDQELAASIQREFSGPTFRLYANDDPVGVELGAALKNIIAIGAGICDGLGLGSNSIAALITRGLAEITRLAIALGGRPRTLSGLAGLGDLVLTCNGVLSRNRTVGIELAKGRKLADIVNSMTMIAEGVETTAAACGLARKCQVDMPITEQMDAILRGRTSPRDAIRELMERALKTE